MFTARLIPIFFEEITMQRYTKVLMALALAVVVCLPGAAAALTFQGDPFDCGSWAQRFVADVGTYDALEAFMMSPATDFEAPGWENFSVTGWTARTPNPDYARGLGPSSNNVQMDLKFSGSQATPLSFDFFAWSGGILTGNIVDSAHCTWNGSGWSFSTALHDPTGQDYNRVPICSTWLLLGSGLLGLGGLGWRRARAGAA
jgi:hypothetical protein